MMAVPSRQSGDLLLTNRAKSPLLLPEVKELLPVFQVVLHFEAQTFLEVDLPLRVVGIGLLSDLHMSFDPRLEGQGELYLMRPLVICCLAEEDPITAAL